MNFFVSHHLHYLSNLLKPFLLALFCWSSTTNDRSRHQCLKNKQVFHLGSSSTTISKQPMYCLKLRSGSQVLIKQTILKMVTLGPLV
ncbi:hypothetical protein BpHYR1_051683 [Brachionus plicatilis]|uniref:Secreted protein n=1 Tax=Brachionus plicatilis TaxID=10195 RepID=A0A3M7SQY2_BRAPC|nr:hypothetical protein BpHYR1_051683 [Brachionus plicatilis]